MTAFEEKALELLKSIDEQLRAIREDAAWLRDRQDAVAKASEAMSRMMTKRR
ncbi:hypothetical protein D3C83_307310 [compost metagenome]